MEMMRTDHKFFIYPLSDWRILDIKGLMECSSFEKFKKYDYAKKLLQKINLWCMSKLFFKKNNHIYKVRNSIYYQQSNRIGCTITQLIIDFYLYQSNSILNSI